MFEVFIWGDDLGSHEELLKNIPHQTTHYVLAGEEETGFTVSSDIMARAVEYELMHCSLHKHRPTIVEKTT